MISLFTQKSRKVFDENQLFAAFVLFMLFKETG